MLHRTLGVDKSLKAAHQTWFIPDDDATLIESVIARGWDLMHSDRFGGIKNMLLLQDLLRIPASKYPTHITHRKGHGHTYTMTLAVHNEEEGRLAIDFFKELTRQNYPSVSPLLLKGHHIPDDVLAESQTVYSHKLKEISEKTDPHNLLSSALWQKLLTE